MRISLCCMVLLAVLLMPGRLHAQCLAELTSSYVRQFTVPAPKDASVGLRLNCDLVTGLYFEPIDGHNDFTVDETVVLPLNPLWQPSNSHVSELYYLSHGSVLYYVDPGIGRHFGAGLGWFGTLGAGVMFPLGKGNGLFASVEVRRRFRFGDPANAGTEISCGIVFPGA